MYYSVMATPEPDSRERRSQAAGERDNSVYRELCFRQTK
ncbi:hypothetical protein EVAR_82629_1 [Eumeta japonica]|uniref:Uncharacterized protein n=1 Tax=Eumeta variegata TaxID=151549 RepID=A0A4C1VDJ9_EUMVA|nr:hypothetical protein EVAR_82629_1 [Eumeta japonica]